MRLIGEVENRLTGQMVHDLAPDTETTHPRIKNADRGCALENPVAIAHGLATR